MKMYMKALTAIIMLSGLFFFTACEKEGPAGPAGSAGSQGEQGLAGTDGAKGDQGEPGAKGEDGDAGPRGAKGTANVIYSDWMDVTFTNSAGQWKGSIDAPEITQDVLDKGEVAVYMRVTFSGASTYFKLNYMGAASWVNMQLKAGGIDISASFNAGVNYDFRYVIIPGGVAAGARRRGVDINNFIEVAKAFKINI